ncbi:MAG: MG2 domain-containing protein [Clostridia bacterium]|nr:MG2 domain-containing protein [Clostridia bacterium]
MELRTRVTGTAVVLFAVMLLMMSTVPVYGAREANAWVFATARTYLPEDRPELGVRGWGIEKLTLDVYRFDGRAYFGQGGHDAVWELHRAQFPGMRLVKTVRVPVARPGKSLQAAVKLDPLPEGCYAVIARSPQLRSKETTWFTVSRIGLISKQSAGKLLVYAVDLKTGQPAPGVAIAARGWNTEGSPIAIGSSDGGDSGGSKSASSGISGITDAFGLFTAVLKPGVASAIATGSRGEDFAFLYSSNWWDARSRKIYIYTDRPVYRPNNTVYFKGIARSQGEAGYSVLADRTVSVEIRDARSNPIYRRELTTNNWGSFSGEFTLGAEPSLGEYSIVATIDGEQHWGDFSVAEYRKPEWSVDVTFDRSTYVAGDRVEARCEAKYYFGEPVQNAEVTYRVYTQPAGFLGKRDDDGFDEAYWGGEDGVYGGYYGDVVTQGTAVTDSSGVAQVSFIAPRAATGNYKCIVEADVADATNKKASGRGSTTVAMGTFDIDISTDRYMAAVGERFNVKVRTVSLDGSPASRKLSIEMLKRTYTEKGYTDSPVSTKAAETPTSGVAEVSMEAAQPGTVVLRARGADERGNEIVTEDYIWVTSGAMGCDAEFRHDITVVCDKPRYAIGDTAKILVTAPSDVHSVLLTVEDSEIRHSQVVALESGSALVDLPIVADCAPNTYVCATAVAARVMQTASRGIVIDVPERILSVEIQPNKASYRPGETATYLVTTKDSNGDAMPAEVSFGLVDESIYAVRPDTTIEIEKFFHGRRQNSVTTENSFPLTYYGGADKEGGSETTRKDFPDTAMWIPSIVTDANGHAVVQVKMPDSLTTWRACVKAHTCETVVGQAQAKVTVSLPLVARLALPRHYTMGDRGSVTGVVHNYTRFTRRASVTLKAEGANVIGRVKKYVSIEPGGQATVEWDVEPTGVGQAKFTIRARSWFITDGVELSVPVLPFGEKGEGTWAGEISPSEGQPSAVMEFELPADSVSGTEAVTLDVSPGYAGVVEGALDYLAAYPYGCVEQTMSAFMPDVLAHEAFASLGVSISRSQEELAAMVNSGLARLYKYQHDDGGFGWWEFDQSMPWMTSYVLYGLSRAKRAGFEVSEEAISRAAAYLRSELPKIEKPADRAYAYYALATQGTLDQATEKSLSKFAKIQFSEAKPAPLAIAYAALASASSGNMEIAREGAERLAALAVRSSGQTYWKTEDSSYWWRSETAESTAWAMMAMLEAEPASPLIPEAARHLAVVRDGSQWRSTRESAAGVIALVEYMLHSHEDIAAEREVTVMVNGQEAGKLRAGGGAAGTVDSSSAASLEIDRKFLKPGANVVEITSAGGAVHYSMKASWCAPADEIKASGDCATITREYFRVDRAAVPPKGESYSVQSFSGEAKVGEELLVRVTVDAKSALEYMAFEDPVPSGFEIVEDFADPYSWNYWYDRREARDNRMVFFSTWIDAGKRRVFEYVIAPERPGIYRVMPTRAWSMYYPDLTAHGDSAEIRVVGNR